MWERLRALEGAVAGLGTGIVKCAVTMLRRAVAWCRQPKCWQPADQVVRLVPNPPGCPSAAVRLLEEEGRRLQRSRLKLRMQPVALYAGLPAAHQLGVFEPAPRGVRKVGGRQTRLCKCLPGFGNARCLPLWTRVPDCQALHQTAKSACPGVPPAGHRVHQHRGNFRHPGGNCLRHRLLLRQAALLQPAVGAGKPAHSTHQQGLCAAARGAGRCA
jgi:hypothetical protein